MSVQAPRRRLMDTDTAYDATLWSKLTDQGYTGVIFPEAYGGVSLGKVELILLMEEAGRALLPGPFFSTVVLAGSVVDAVGTPAHKKQYLAPICREMFAPPWQFWKPARVGTRAMFN